MKIIPNKIKRVFIGVELDEEKVTNLAELLSQEVEKLTQEPPKLIVGDEKHLVLPGILLVENQKDHQGKLILEGRVLLKNKKFKIEIS
jgi:hypothetical protein